MSKKEKTKLKRLPRNQDGTFKREFWANNKKFIIRSQEEGIGLERYSRLMEMSSVVMYNRSFGSITQNWLKLDGMLNEFMNGGKNLRSIFVHIQNVLDGINSSQNQQYDFSFWACTLFVTYEDEDMTKYIADAQSAKIQDWVAGGIHEADLQELAKKKFAEFSRQSASEQKDGNK